MGVLQALAGILLLAGRVENHAGMQFLEDTVPIGPGEFVDGIHRGFALGGGVLGPGRQQRGGEIGDRAADRLGELLAGDLVLLLLDGPHAQHQPRDAIVLVDLENLVGETDRLLDIAIEQNRQEGAVEQIIVVRIAA